MPRNPRPVRETRRGQRRCHLIPIIRAALYAITILLFAICLGGCAFVHQKDREFLSDPIMQRHDDGLESGLESHDMPRREGATGGSSGSGGGCGC
jgi:hypothetical protein